MRANEYVKLVGWEYAKLNASSCSHQYYFHHNGYEEVCVSELIRLVESHDFIECLGGYQFVKENLPSGYFGEGEYKDLIQKCLEDMEIINE